ncbi:SET domain-containing protein [Penicillium sp. IBT 18751x]|nr:SET domain-containing protein [Penicillium sp. IBT 18751x]
MATTENPESDSDSNAGADLQSSDVRVQPSVRQFHSDARFPQRRGSTKGTSVPTLQPSSIDKLISGIWWQLHSPITLRPQTKVQDRRPEISLSTGVSREVCTISLHIDSAFWLIVISLAVQVFRAISGLCKEYNNQSKSSRALEMVVQAHWVECYEARIASILLECPSCTKSEARIIALKEACSTLGWLEKELRNRLAIWRGYKEIKDYGGWASLIFAGSGVYRLCKYRIGFNDGLATRLRHIASSLEVAADTLHPGWRDLLRIVNQNEQRRYSGHPHEWVTVDSGPALPLKNTYSHLSLPGGFNFEFVNDCVIDQEVFGLEDPRREPEIDPNICRICKKQQADDMVSNHCSCFPTLFGSVRYPPPVQIYHTASGKNNGVVARCHFERGTAIAEFVGFITYGIDGLDVMMGGTPERPYQIFQGNMGNFTRFINHSCRPNSQFQRFYWRGIERVLVVSRGVSAGSEITVDYSDFYWRKLKKNCLCGEPGCRYAHQAEV